MKHLEYPAIVRPLSHEEGKGYLVEFPDLPGCYAEGETPEDALREAEDAVESWIKTAQEFNDPIPQPQQSFSGQWRLRIPKSLHASLVYRARYEGVSLNTLVTTLLAQSVGMSHHHGRISDHKIRS